MTYRSYVGSDAQFVYNETWGHAQTYMMYDIAALQYLYGADFTTNAGNTTYTWNPTTGATFVDGARRCTRAATGFSRRSGTATAPTPTICRTTGRT